MGYFRRYDPEQIAQDDRLVELFQATDEYEYAKSDYLAEKAADFEFTDAFERAFDIWLDSQEEQ